MNLQTVTDYLLDILSDIKHNRNMAEVANDIKESYITALLLATNAVSEYHKTQLDKENN
jgi:hypothetical protein